MCLLPIILLISTKSALFHTFTYFHERRCTLVSRGPIERRNPLPSTPDLFLSSIFVKISKRVERPSFFKLLIDNELQEFPNRIHLICRLPGGLEPDPFSRIGHALKWPFQSTSTQKRLTPAPALHKVMTPGLHASSTSRAAGLLQ